MKKKLVTFMVALAMIVTTIGMSPLAAHAEDPASTQAATVDGTADSSVDATVPTNGMVVTGDDDQNDATKETNDNTGSVDINVYAKISGADADDIIYKIDVTWGSMQFVYDWGGSWNTETHEYSTGANGSAEAGWVVKGYLTNADGSAAGENNKISVTNHSNYPVTSSFAYANTVAASGSAFNADPNANHAVTGIFSETYTDLSSNVNSEGYIGKGDTQVAGMQTPKFDLNTLDATNTVMSGGAATKEERETAKEHTKDMYFTLCGTPDSSVVINDFTTVGTITLTIVPYTAP